MGRSVFGAADSRTKTILWLNLFKFNHDLQDGGVLPMHCSYHKDAALALQGDMFQKEVEMTKPNVMIFLTGPYYDEIIKQFFPQARFETLLDTHSEREAAVVAHPCLPALSFRTYHPGYMSRRRRRMAPILPEILSRIRRECPSSD